MKFELADIYAPDKKLDITTWNFSADLQKFFGDLDNNEITDLLIKRRVVKKWQTDPESSCSYFYFTTKAQATAFLNRLNTVEEIRNYEEPEPLPEEMVAFAAEDWRTIRKYLHENLTGEQWHKLVTGPLKEIGMYELVCVENGLGEPRLYFKAEIEAEMKREKKKVKR
jgi:hypothetical protein